MSASIDNALDNDQRSIDIVDLFTLLRSRIKLLFFVTFVLTLTGLVIALLLPNKYESESLLVPVSNSGQSKLLGLAGQFSSLANLAGLDLGGLGGGKPVLIAETLRSRAFVEYFLKKRQLIIPLFAGAGEALETGDWIYDTDVYNHESSQWTRKVGQPFKPEPSYFEAYEKFTEDVLNIYENKKNGTLKVTIELTSPHQAKMWNDWLIEDLNEWIREKDKLESKKNIDYLTVQIKNSDIQEMQKVFYSLIEKEMTDYMLTNVQTEYAVKTLDPAVVPLVKSGPHRLFILLAAALFGFILGVLIILARAFIK